VRADAESAAISGPANASCERSDPDRPRTVTGVA
jgi:hypothetical protein